MSIESLKTFNKNFKKVECGLLKQFILDDLDSAILEQINKDIDDLNHNIEYLRKYKQILKRKLK